MSPTSWRCQETVEGVDQLRRHEDAVRVVWRVFGGHGEAKGDQREAMERLRGHSVSHGDAERKYESLR